MSHTMMTLGAVLVLFWLALSGHFDAQMLALGACSVALVLLLVVRLARSDGLPYPLRRLSFGLLRYWFWLGGEVIRANIDVVRCIWHPAMPIDPVTFTLPLTQRTLFGKMLYANSITLTPGTVTVAVERGQLHIHALTRSNMTDLQNGDFGRRVSHLESRS